jgi:predicted membrane protein
MLLLILYATVFGVLILTMLYLAASRYGLSFSAIRLPVLNILNLVLIFFYRANKLPKWTLWLSIVYSVLYLYDLMSNSILPNIYSIGLWQISVFSIPFVLSALLVIFYALKKNSKEILKPNLKYLTLVDELR